MSGTVIPFPERPDVLPPSVRITCVACQRAVAETTYHGDLLTVHIPCRCGRGGRQLALPGIELR